jgi:hypothetical protein
VGWCHLSLGRQIRSGGHETQFRVSYVLQVN